MVPDHAIVVACDDDRDHRLAALAGASDMAIVPVRPVELAPLIAGVPLAAVAILDEPSDEATRDAITGTILASETYVPVVRLWSPAAAKADAPASLWLDPAAGAGAIVAALHRAGRVRTLLCAARSRQMVMAGAALTPPPLVDPWGLARNASILIVDSGIALPVLAPICAARGLAMVGAPTLAVGGTYLDLRAFDAVVIGPDIGAADTDAFTTWLHDNPRWRDVPVIRLARTRSVHADRDDDALVDAIAIADPRLPEALYAAARLHALTEGLCAAVTTMDAAGLADPQTGLMWPEAFRGALAQTLAWGQADGCETHLIRVTAEPGTGALPATMARLTARMLRRADFVARFADGSVLSVLVGADRMTAERVVARIANVLRHTAIALPGQATPPTEVRCFQPLPDESASQLLQRLLPQVVNPALARRAAG